MLRVSSTETALQQSMSFLYVIMYKCQNCHQYINRSTSICLKTNNRLLVQHYHNNAFKNMQMSPEMHKPQVALIICNICILFPSQEVTQYKHRADVNFIRNLPDWLLLLSLYTTGVWHEANIIYYISLWSLFQCDTDNRHLVQI